MRQQHNFFYQKENSKKFRLFYKWVGPYLRNIRPQRRTIRGAENPSPFFIIGCGRSGTTLLRRQLYASPEIYIPPESYMLGPMYYSFLRNATMTWNELVDVVMSKLIFHEEFYTFEVNDRLPELISTLHQLPQSKQNFSSMLDATYVWLAKNKGKEITTWGDKTPLNTLYLHELKDTFPNARFIHLVRDGRDVVNSYTKNNMKSFENSCDRWASSLRLVEKFGEKFPDSVLELKYEHLVNSNDEALKKLCRFIGVDQSTQFWKTPNYDPKELGDIKYHAHHANALSQDLNANSIGKGKESWSIEKITNKQLQKEFTKYLARFEYD